MTRNDQFNSGDGKLGPVDVWPDSGDGDGDGKYGDGAGLGGLYDNGRGEGEGSAFSARYGSVYPKPWVDEVPA